MMMKNLLGVLLLLPLVAFGQVDKLQKGFEFSGFVSNNGFYICYNPNLFISKGKHAVGAGPVFTRLPEPYTTNQGNIKFTGIHGFYKFMPNTEGKHFTFYFRYDLIWQMYRTLFYSYALQDDRLENYLGYGFNLLITKNLFITQHLGLGVHYIMREYKGSAGTISKSTDWDEAAIAGIGLGYVFGGKGR